MNADIAVVGAGAAGMFAALAARGALDGKGGFRAPPASAPPVLLLDGKERIGRKILVSGGGRCNVTNADAGPGDFDTGSPNVLRTVLAGFPPASVRAFFEGRGVPLRVEPLGKVFPADGGAKEVLAALLAALEEAGVATSFGEEARRVEPEKGGGWRVNGHRVGRVIVATGGRSVPSTGSTGFGYGLAERLGHAVAPPLPALAALGAPVAPELSGVTLPAILTVEDERGRALRRAAGSLLFAHRGVTGPAAFDVSVAVARRAAAGLPVTVRADFWTLADPSGPFAPWLGLPKPPGACLPEAPPPSPPSAVERHLLAAAKRAPRATVGAVLGERLPRRLVEVLVPGSERTLAALTRGERRAAADAVTALDLGVRGTDGFDRAEVTAGGVPLSELHRRTLESRRAPGLHFCGEVCDATGRLGGFNFQWAWASGYAAGRGAAAATGKGGGV